MSDAPVWDDPDHPRTCWKRHSDGHWRLKGVYESEHHALRRGLVGLYPYECPTCRQWHMSTRPPKPGEDDSQWSHGQPVVSFGEALRRLGLEDT